MPNPEGIATGTSLNRDDAVCRALRELLLTDVERLKDTPLRFQSDYNRTYQEVDRLMSLYEELGGVTSDE